MPQRRDREVGDHAARRARRAQTAAVVHTPVGRAGERDHERGRRRRTQSRRPAAAGAAAARGARSDLQQRRREVRGERRRAGPAPGGSRSSIGMNASWTGGCGPRRPRTRSAAARCRAATSSTPGAPAPPVRRATTRAIAERRDHEDACRRPARSAARAARPGASRAAGPARCGRGPPPRVVERGAHTRANRPPRGRGS